VQNAATDDTAEERGYNNGKIEMPTFLPFSWRKNCSIGD
jgi:hypothetical protein